MGPVDWSHEREKNYFETDASEVEDLYSSPCADGLPNRPTSSIANSDSDLFSAPEEEREAVNKGVKGFHVIPQTKETKFPEQLSANGRTVLRKHFFKSTQPCFPEDLPRLNTANRISTPSSKPFRTKLSSCLCTRSLVLQAVYGGRGQTPGHFRKTLIRGENPTRGVPTNSEWETESEGYTIDGYTSGALASDEEIGASSFNQGDVSDTNAPSTEIDIERREARVGPRPVGPLLLVQAKVRVTVSLCVPFDFAWF